MKNLFKDIETFMIRVPSLPINLLANSTKTTKNLDKAMLLLDEANYKNQFDESILLASPDLYESIQQYINKGTVRDTDYLLNSVYKYFSRSCSRCTPFGLFSTVAFGNICSENTSFELSKNDIQRKPQIDSNWLYEVVFMYETKYLKSLRYTVNESVAIHKNKALLFGCTKNSKGEKLNRKSVNYSNALEIVLESAKEYIMYSEIIEKLRNTYSKVNEDTFHVYVQSLIKEEYLVSDLRPPLSISDQLDYFISKLSEYNINTDVFIDLEKHIEEYSVGCNKDKKNSLMNIYKIMKNIHDSKNYLTIDSSFEYKECNLNKKEIQKINELVNLFIQFNVNEPFDILSEYKNKFIEKYGFSRCVPIIELTDNDTGLGFPSHYDGSGTNVLGEYVNPWVNFFERKYIEAIRKGQEIEITNVDMKKLLSDKSDTGKLPKSMEIYFNYFKENGKDVFLLSNIFGSTHAGKSFGRFSHFMDNPKEFYQKINSVYGKDDECQTCEFTFLPESLYTANVIRNIHGSSYETSFGTTNSKNASRKMKLDEILVGIEDNKFYLQSTKNNKRVIPTATNMFNPQLKPNILRFIDDVSTDGLKIYNKPWQFLLEKFGYLPTIRYKNFILEQEKWILKLEDMRLPNQFSFDEFNNKLKEIVKEKRIPKWINIVEADQKLLLNLEENRCVKVMLKMLEKSQIIVERYNEEVEHPVKFKNNSYCCELVIPLISDFDLDSDKTKTNVFNGNYDKNRIKEPLDGWLYFKIYGVEENIDFLLGEALLIPLQQLLNNGEIESYFFIQYKDPKLHLRLRIKAAKSKLIVVQPKILDILSKLIKNSIISKYCIDCYELELERYGGYELMDLAHTVFYRDSLAAQSIIHEKEIHNIKIPDEFLGIIIVFFHLNVFELSLEEMFVFLNCDKHVKQHQKEFKNNKDLYIDFTIQFLSGMKVNQEIDLILNILTEKTESMKMYLNKIKEIYPQNRDIKISILDSLLHMSMNRLFGPNVEFERKVRTLARHTFYNVYNRNKKIGVLDGLENAKI